MLKLLTVQTVSTPINTYSSFYGTTDCRNNEIKIAIYLSRKNMFAYLLLGSLCGRKAEIVNQLPIDSGPTYNVDSTSTTSCLSQCYYQSVTGF